MPIHHINVCDSTFLYYISLRRLQAYFTFKDAMIVIDGIDGVVMEIGFVPMISHSSFKEVEECRASQS